MTVRIALAASRGETTLGNSRENSVGNLSGSGVCASVYETRFGHCMIGPVTHHWVLASRTKAPKDGAADQHRGACETKGYIYVTIDRGCFGEAARYGIVLRLTQRACPLCRFPAPPNGRPANEHRPKKEYGFRKALQNPMESEILKQKALQDFPEPADGISRNPFLRNIHNSIPGIMLRTHSGSVCLDSNPGKATIFSPLETN